MFRTNGVKFGVKFFVATMVLSSAGLLYTAAQGRAQDNASGEVKETAKKLVEKGGAGSLREVAKVHFRTAHEVAPSEYPAPPTREWSR